MTYTTEESKDGIVVLMTSLFASLKTEADD